MRGSHFHFSLGPTDGQSWPLTGYFSEFQKRQQRSSMWSSESQQNLLETESSMFTLTAMVLSQEQFCPLVDVNQCLETFSAVPAQGKLLLHLVVVGCPPNAQDSPHSKGTPHLYTSEVEKPCVTHHLYL